MNHGDIFEGCILDQETEEWIDVSRLNVQEAQELLEVFCEFPMAVELIEKHLMENYLYNKHTNTWVDWRSLADNLRDQEKYK